MGLDQLNAQVIITFAPWTSYIPRPTAAIVKTTAHWWKFWHFGHISCIFMSCYDWEVRNLGFASAAHHDSFLSEFWILWNAKYLRLKDNYLRPCIHRIFPYGVSPCASVTRWQNCIIVWAGGHETMSRYSISLISSQRIVSKCDTFCIRVTLLFKNTFAT